MNNDEIEKMLNYIIERHEPFAESVEKADKRMNRLDSAFVSLFSLVGENTKAIKDLTSNVETLRGEVKQLKDAQAATDERLNIFINVLERYITRDDNGGNKNGKSS